MADTDSKRQRSPMWAVATILVVLAVILVAWLSVRDGGREDDATIPQVESGK